MGYNSNIARSIFSERKFRASYALLRANGIRATSDDVRFLPLLYVSLAISVRMAPENFAGDARTRQIIAERYYWSCTS